VPIDYLAEFGEIASEGSLLLNLEEEDSKVLFVVCFNDHTYSLLDIVGVFNYIDIARYLILPVNYTPVTHDGCKYLVLEALYEFWVPRDVLNDKEHVVIDRVLIFLGELPIKGHLQKTLFGNIFQGLIELNHRLIY
jgi:hypothetical protein